MLENSNPASKHAPGSSAQKGPSTVLGAFAMILLVLATCYVIPLWWDRWLWACIALAFGVAVLILWKVPQWQVSHLGQLQPKEQFDCENEARKTLATILGGALLLAGAFATWKNVQLQQATLNQTRESSDKSAGIALDTLRESHAASERNARIAQDSLLEARRTADRNAQIAQETLLASQRSSDAVLELSRQGQITDRFTRAVEQLGAKDKLEVRLGGIYSLESIANESKDLHWPAVEVLSTYVHANAPVYVEGKSQVSWQVVLNEIKLNTDLHPAPDIQAILTVLGRRGHHEWELNVLALSDRDLRGANLDGGHFEQVNFYKAYLDHTSLRQARLTKTNFYKTSLQYANFDRALANEATFVEANLDGATLTGANLTGAQLLGAKLMNANLSGADLRNARFGFADLTGAYLYGAKLQSTDLNKAELRYSHVEGTDLSQARGLTQERINGAWGNALTKLPANLCLPRAWDGVTATTPNACPAAN